LQPATIFVGQVANLRGAGSPAVWLRQRCSAGHSRKLPVWRVGNPPQAASLPHRQTVFIHIDERHDHGEQVANLRAGCRPVPLAGQQPAAG
jgi:hypothetical protein